MFIARNKLGLILLIILPQILLAFPAPQDDNTTSTSRPSKTTTTTTTEKSDDVDYVDADVKKAGKKSKPVKDSSSSSEESSDDEDNVGEFIGDIIEGAFSVLRHTVETVSKVVHNMSIPEKVGDAVKVGMNVTHKLIKIGEKALENPDEIIKEKKILLKGLGKTIEETGHIFKEGVDEIGKHAKLGSSFVKSYSETMLGQLDGFLKIFDNRLRCNTECHRKKEGTEEKRVCEEKFCKNIDYEKKDEDSKEETEEEKKENLTEKKQEEKNEEEKTVKKDKKEKDNELDNLPFIE